MKRYPRVLLLLFFLLFILTPTILAAKATSFCKCTCNSNSTIIPLTGDSTSPNTDTPATARKGGGTCSDCNRQFCLDYNLPICKGVDEEAVFTTCFQRDSVKDQLVVYTFIILTVGLLVYALVRPYLEKSSQTSQAGGGQYAPVASDERR